jgi:transcriptional regulator with XRE-family HTH domain
METQHALREYRLERDISCAELAKTLGMAETTLRSYENGNRIISAETAIEIEAAIGIPRSRLRSDLWDANNPPAEVRQARTAA